EHRAHTANEPAREAAGEPVDRLVDRLRAVIPRLEERPSEPVGQLGSRLRDLPSEAAAAEEEQRRERGVEGMRLRRLEQLVGHVADEPDRERERLLPDLLADRVPVNLARPLDDGLRQTRADAADVDDQLPERGA